MWPEYRQKNNVSAFYQYTHLLLAPISAMGFPSYSHSNLQIKQHFLRVPQISLFKGLFLIIICFLYFRLYV